MNYELQDITIASICKDCSQPTPRTLQAHVAPCGLAYHQSHHGTHSGPEWTVTHIASGLTLGKAARYFETPGQCRSFIAQVGALVDWTAEQPALTDEIRAKVDSAALDCQCFEITYL